MTEHNLVCTREGTWYCHTHPTAEVCQDHACHTPCPYNHRTRSTKEN